jgi:hypothetical protein
MEESNPSSSNGGLQRTATLTLANPNPEGVDLGAAEDIAGVCTDEVEVLFEGRAAALPWSSPGTAAAPLLLYAAIYALLPEEDLTV